MNILIYVPELDQTWGGVRQYAVGLIKLLANSINDGNTYFIYHNAKDPEIEYITGTNSHISVVTDLSVNYIPLLPDKLSKRAINFFLRKLNLKELRKNVHKSHIELICEKYKIDIIHCPYQYIPNIIGVKLITTLHDVQELHFPEFFTPEDRASRAVRWLDYLNRADRVVVSYEHIKDDLIKYFSVDLNKISVILLDMGKLWFDKFSDKDIVSLNKFNLPEKFIFLPANTWKHKNHIRLIEAVNLIKINFGIKVNIVCSGHLNDYYYSDLMPAIERFGLSEQIKFIGIISEIELFSMYKYALGVIVPTLYEAGSFPLMESILLNLPVICSNVTSLPVTVNNPMCLFNPLDLDSIAEKMMLLWSSNDFRQKITENHEQAAYSLLHTQALQIILDMYKAL